MNKYFNVGRHIISNYDLTCKYCGFYMTTYNFLYERKIIEMIKCLSDEEKAIKDILE